MVQTLAEIQGGGGSMKVGTTGTISTLMSRELDLVKSAPNKTQESYRKKPPSICSFVAGSATSPKRMKPKTSSDEASSRTSNGKNHNSPENALKTKNYTRKLHSRQKQRIPILESGNSSVDETPFRQKAVRKGPRIVEIVDIKCGNTEKPWASPITNPLKKLSFSKLSV